MKLTLPQQDIYLEHLLYLNEPIHNIGAKIEIKGELNVEILKKAYVELINQHDAYRTTFSYNQENIEQQVTELHYSSLSVIDFSCFKNPNEEANKFMQKEFLKPFDLSSGNFLYTFILVKVNNDLHYIFSNTHHIINDGMGTSLMFQRFVQNYNEILEFGKVTSEFSLRYEDFVKDDIAYQNSDSFNNDKSYWIEKFKNLPEALLEKELALNKVNKSSREGLVVKRELYNQLNQLAIDFKCSIFHLILGVLYVYFGRKHQNNDFAIGLPVLNRGKSTYKKTVGLFMGVSPLRMQFNFESTFRDFINEIKNQLRQDYRHQKFPLGKLIQELRLFNEKERIFNITLSYQKQNFSDNFKNTKTEVIPLCHESELNALTVFIREFDGLEDVVIDFDYNLSFFDNKSIKQVTNHFENLLKDILFNPEKKINEFEYLSSWEQQQILIDFNSTKVDCSKDKTFLDLFEEQVKLYPQNFALQDDVVSYSYLELEKLSNQIAEFLITIYGKEDKSPIAVLLDRSANMVAILLGILKSGRSYIPLDPNFPMDRLNYIVQNSQAKILITEKKYNLDNTNDVSINTLANILENSAKLKGIVNHSISSQDTAYIIYTSGSTGNPKGVEIGHQSLLNFLTSIQNKPGINSKDIMFSVTTYSFDISILEFFVPLISGATLYVANQDTISDPTSIIEKLQEVKPTIIQATPSFYQMLFNANWQGSKELKVFCGGDLLSEALAEKLINHSSEVWNMYGPTETTIWSSTKQIEQPSDAFNIGKPINNTQFYILDEFLKPKPVGTAGAIYIAGDGLAKGYYKNEALTNEKFIENPFGTESFLYETGDVGKWNSQGEIEFLGRNDNQVKIRGYRIELGDIESQLNQIEGIEESVVIAKKGKDQESFLVAYILKKSETIDEIQINNQLKEKLPYYMIPNVIIPLEEFPLTPNQKVDRKALSQRDIQQNINRKKIKKPNSDLEIKLVEYWSEVLNVNESISITDNFFTLGGHSLNAVKLIGLISRYLSLEVSLKNIFDYPTIESLAIYLQKLEPSRSSSIPVSKVKELYEITPSQNAIWLASQQKRSSIAYNMSAGYIVEGNLSVARINKSVNQIIEKFEILRTNFIEVNGIPFQKINNKEKVQFEISIEQHKNGAIEEVINRIINKEFDLEKEVLIRVHLIQLESNQNVLLFSTHHIIMDGLSLEIFITEFIQSYKENVSEKSDENTLKLQFRDYSEWSMIEIEKNKSKNESYWQTYLQNYKPKNSFDRDFSNQSNEQNGNQLTFELTAEVTSGLKNLATKNQITFYTVLISSINVLIYNLSDHLDICVGTVNSGRNILELNNQIGMFVKTLVLRTKIESEQTFINLLKTINSNILEINDYLDVPFDKIPHNVFDVMLVYQNPEFNMENNIEINDLKLISYPVETKFSRIPIVFNFFESGNQLKATIDYNSDLFERDTIELIVLKFTKILNDISINPFMELNSKLEEEEVNSTLDFDFNF